VVAQPGSGAEGSEEKVALLWGVVEQLGKAGIREILLFGIQTRGVVYHKKVKDAREELEEGVFGTLQANRRK
jgi:hypothetical protein